MKIIKNILLLAGGDSSRFLPLSEKNLYGFIGKPLLLHHVENLLNLTEKLWIVTNKVEQNKIIKLTAAYKKVTVIVQKEGLAGQAGAILSAKNYIAGQVIILNASDLFKTNLISKLIIRSKQGRPDAILVAKKINQYFPGGYLVFSKNKVTGIMEKPPKNNVPSDKIRLVVDYFNDFGMLVEVLETLKNKRDDNYEQAINIIIKAGKKVTSLLYYGYWLAIKYPWHVLSMMDFFLGQLKKNYISKEITISKKAILVPPVFLGDHVKIGDYTKIVGPAFIDNNSIVGDFVLIRQSHIGKSCLIGGYSEVARSYLSDQVMLHRNYVGDSVIDKGVLMGAGAVAANFRFDQKIIQSMVNGELLNTNLNKLGAIIGQNTKIGVNATILPGRKVNRNELVLPGTLVNTDIF